MGLRIMQAMRGSPPNSHSKALGIIRNEDLGVKSCKRQEQKRRDAGARTMRSPETSSKRRRLSDSMQKIFTQTLFSAIGRGTRNHGVRERCCLRIMFFDPHHKDRDESAYDFP
jgi:hypothetical protein